MDVPCGSIYPPRPLAQEEWRSWHYDGMARVTPIRLPPDARPRVRRGYFECRYGQLHVHNAMPPGGGFEEGMALLCLHDLNGSGRVFTGLLTLAGQDRTVYAPDLPGFGESDPPTAPPALADYAAALGDFLDHMRLRQLAVLGLRAGALLATELAVARPAQVKRLVLLSVPLLTEAERQAAVSRAPPPAADGAFRSAEWQRWALAAAARYPLRERLAGLSQRVLLLRPRDDLWEATARAREVLVAARLVELEQPGVELLCSAPQRIADPVREFLRVNPSA
jgi:pimeloyl-ACP methyl ester carboxylesterase